MIHEVESNNYTSQLPYSAPIKCTTQAWTFSIPPICIDLLLLTVSGIAVQGNWTGALGEHFIGWANDAALEARYCGQLH